VNDATPPKGGRDDLAQEVEDQSSEEKDRGSAAWGKVPRYVAAMSLTKDALRMAIAISSYAKGNRFAWPSTETLARDLGWITRSTGKPNRRRAWNALQVLMDVGVVRKAGIQRSGERAWTRRYEVAPFPGDDAHDTYASSNADDAHEERATSRGGAPDDAHEIAPTMRTKSADDAHVSYARTDQRTDQKKQKRWIEDEKAELQLLAVRLNLQSASDEELRETRDREAAHAS
jgi:hypothetical protein